MSGTRSAGVASIAIAALVVAVVAMLIVPLPRPLLDALLTLNIAIAVALLMAALFSPRPLGFGSFPTLLVVTTLFRVGLEVSTTRLILGDADAGSVVAAFGGSVVSGSLVVGLVVFAVITIVQLVVVSRGAERVAEVSARFALDAMPGKQMAIDAELRAGAIDAERARARRADLERESQLYGSMDGAMRFVKGDAVAAIVIVVINLIGGLVIGVGQRGMPARLAVETYSLLSIGAGLVAQIPSLLVAVASGLLVTRVASTGDRALGEDLGGQLAGSPRALAGVAVLLVGLGVVPGLPHLPFLVLGLVAGVAAVLVATRTSPAAATDPSARLVVRVRDLPPDVTALAAEIAGETGVPMPTVATQLDPTLTGREAVLVLDGIPVAWTTIDDVGAALRGLVPELLGIDRAQAMVERAPAGQSPACPGDAVVGAGGRGATHRGDAGQVLALEPAIAQDIIAAVRERLGGKSGVILASGDIRRHLRSLLEPELPDVTVLAAHELAPGTAITTAGRIDVA